jgi:hypothetical protein
MKMAAMGLEEAFDVGALAGIPVSLLTVAALLIPPSHRAVGNGNCCQYAIALFDRNRIDATCRSSKQWNSPNSDPRNLAFGGEGNQILIGLSQESDHDAAHQ